MLLRLCEVRPYAAYGSENHRSISTGFTSYSGRFCMPPYSQNADAAHSYIIVHANNVSDSEIAGEEKALRQYVCSATACLPYYQPPYSHLIFSN